MSADVSILGRGRWALALLAMLATATASPSGAVAQDAVVALTHVTVVDVERGTSQPDMTIVIRNRVIQSVAPYSAASIPTGARVENRSGTFVIPGLWDMHAHMLLEGRGWAVAEYVRHGITGVRDMGGQFEAVDSLRRAIASGRIVGPRILAAGPQIENTDALKGILANATAEDSALARRDRQLVLNPAQGTRVVDSLARLGVDMIKARNFADVATYWAIANAARKAHRPLVAHPPVGVDPFALADSGQRSIEHWYYPYDLSGMAAAERDRLVAAYVQHGVAFVPTLRAWNQHRLTVDTLERALNAVRADQRGGPSRDALLRQWTVDLKARRTEHEGRPATPSELGGWNGALDGLAKEIGKLRAAGVIVLAGSDLPFATYPGMALHDELQALVVEAGFTPSQALAAATIVSARFVGMQDSLGTISAGKLADMVVLDANPLIDINNVRRVRAVMRNGKWMWTRAAASSR